MDPDLMTDEELAERANVWVPADGGRGIAMSGARDEELRERCARALERSVFREPILHGMDACRAEVDAILAEIAEAGMVIVPEGRFLRLHAAAWWAFVHVQHPYLVAVTREDLDMYSLPFVEPGDLDALPGEGGRES